MAKITEVFESLDVHFKKGVAIQDFTTIISNPKYKRSLFSSSIDLELLEKKANKY